MVVAKVDATEHEDLARRFQVQGYPTMFVLRNGDPSPYKGGSQSASDIVEYMRKQAGPGYTLINEAADLRAMQHASFAVIVGVFVDLPDQDESQNRRRYAQLVAALRDDFACALVTRKEVLDELELAEGGLKLYVDWNAEPFEYFGDLAFEDVQRWLKQRSLPPVAKLGPSYPHEKLVQEIVYHPTPKVLVFADFADSARADMYYRRLLKAQETHAQQYLFIIGDYTQSDMKKLAVSFGIDTETTAPQLLIFEGRESKYLMSIDDELSLKNILNFLTEHQAGRLEQYADPAPRRASQ